ncbi:sensor histidine kinase [Streptosporangiaceae bacterium NEAU-GS5]|nr:sensor histidine kinase [Streptosporangiaceae bacterium NEAU-GS5]
MKIEDSFWRAIAAFRAASLVYAAVLLLQAGSYYAHPAAGWLVIAVMTVWAAAASAAYPVNGGWRLLVLDLVVTLCCLLATVYVEGPRVAPSTMPITATWVAGVVVAWAVARGRRAGLAAAVIMSVADFYVRGVRGFDLQTVSVNGAVLLLMAGWVVGHVARLAKQAEARLQRATEIEAAGRERERLARGIHDSVLQVLSLVQRRGRELGGEAAELGRLAGEQEAVLRELVRSAPPADPPPRSRRTLRGSPLLFSRLLTGGGGEVEEERPPAPNGRPEGEGLADLCALIRRYGGASVSVATPATPVLLQAHVANEVAAAVSAALDNVRAHCGPAASAWILAEQDDDRVIVSVRDDGPGIPDGRLEQAVAEGRLGLAQSIRGRIADLKGSVTVTSSRDGTEIEMSVPAGGV